MPELAEVAYHAKQWKSGVGEQLRVAVANGNSRVFRDVDLSTFREKLDGKILERIFTHGKRMLFQLSGDLWLGVHLGMTGSLGCYELNREHEKHDHLVLGTGNIQLVFNDPRQFGKIDLWVSRGLPDFWRALPPQPMDDGFTLDLFLGYCVRRRRSVLKSFLLLQECFPGIGNWMADEILWRARLDPRSRVGSLSDKESQDLYESLRFVSLGAMQCIAVDYGDPPRSWLFSHRWKAGGICPETNVTLDRIVIGGRTTCWSPAWQS